MSFLPPRNLYRSTLRRRDEQLQQPEEEPVEEWEMYQDRIEQYEMYRMEWLDALFAALCSGSDGSSLLQRIVLEDD